MKNVLFIGDCRTARNYGSIATTEALLKMINNIDSTEKISLKIIDRRSFDRPTPVEGFTENKKIKNTFKRYVPFFIRQKYSSFKKRKNNKEKRIASLHIPYRFELFESFFNKMQEGEILQYEKGLLEWADVVFINGEGTIINGTDSFGIYNSGGRYVIFLAWLAKFKFNKPTCIVNHTVDPNNNDVYEMISKVYPNLDFVSVREPLSLDKLKQNGVQNAIYIPDALFSYVPLGEWTPDKELSEQIDFSRPYICIGDSAAYRKNVWQDAVKWDILEFYNELITELKKIVPQVIFIDGFTSTKKKDDPKRLPVIDEVIRKNKIGYVNLANCDYHNLYYVFQHAELFISGRWHSSILALKADIPILLWGSDSHKTRALYSVIDYPYPFFETKTLPIHVKDIAETSRNILADKSEIKERIKMQVEKISKRSEDNILFIKKIMQNNS